LRVEIAASKLIQIDVSQYLILVKNLRAFEEKID